ncbi:MAG: hypothetical protein FWC68_06310 [Oscillospiraceae bacterium]|nr:hypothetical protein [Oscillospiraceae bacterium]
MQLSNLIEQNENIVRELNLLDRVGSRVESHVIVVPIMDSLLYVKPVYQIMLNESQVPILRRVIVASGNKIAIGNTLEEAIEELLITEEIDIEISGENIEQLIRQIINANRNLEQSNATNNWELIGRDIQRLQELIRRLENLHLIYYEMMTN